jgi:hypothetical protein
MPALVERDRVEKTRFAVSRPRRPALLGVRAVPGSARSRPSQAVVAEARLQRALPGELAAELYLGDDQRPGELAGDDEFGEGERVLVGRRADPAPAGQIEPRATGEDSLPGEEAVVGEDLEAPIGLRPSEPEPSGYLVDGDGAEADEPGERISRSRGVRYMAARSRARLGVLLCPERRDRPTAAQGSGSPPARARLALSSHHLYVTRDPKSTNGISGSWVIAR